MGAVAINRKRSDESFNFNQQSTNPLRNSPYFQASKKRRFSFAMSEDSGKPASSSSNPTISRISRYPDAKAPLRREIHAPSRGILRYGKAKSNDYCEKDGNFFVRKYDDAKRSALEALRFVKKDKEFVGLSDEVEKEAVVSDDSSVEEIVVVDCDDDEEDLVGEKKKKKKNQPSFSSGVTDVKKGDNFRVEDTSMMLDSLSLDRDVSDASSLEAYRKLMQSAERRNSKLEALGFEIVLNEKRLSQLRQSRPKPVEKRVEVPREPFIPLTEDEEAEVYRAFSGRNRRKVLATHENSNIDITGEVLQCLTPSSWLNDEVINVYLELLKERETREPKKYLKCHYFNTFFYKKLVSDSGYNFKAVRRWTTQRKLGYALIDCDMIFVPIHRGVHWTLAVINNRESKLLYLDSLNGVDPMILNALAKYMGDEAKEKSGKNIEVNSWEMEFVEDLPQQMNGYDCGMFMLKYIDFFSRGLGLCFSQEHMPYFRLRTAKEILRLRAD
ncbi:Ulp1 protease family C-terminal catalytic domain [Arabidopsis thaliana x Arabidopsis arenosa]|uniref:Ulp1 protease family C-terminal catalytic domain n=1 Tax=Arabidopsis thaliana x Arabidopsis arenosa TaxID=1240361 RepID=A0A8T1Y6H1_9BRAS|nr:Ulp1 protease family C-terminal catalytic domain [Arabidopsis thaliana x Arabidopsis arenosa]